MRPEVSSFFSALHMVVFKPRGYRKVRHTFEKVHGDHAVAFQFQGSDWNSAGSPWRFYMNAGLRFLDLPRRTPDRDFPTIHSWTRVGATLSQLAEPHYEVVDGHEGNVLGRISAVIEDAERYFATNHQLLRQKYESRPMSFLGYLDDRLMK